MTTTLASIQRDLLALLSPPPKPTESQKRKPPPILLGHSLESDLTALKLAHPRCIDTALLYHHSRGRPLKPGLAWLTNKWCSRVIQNRGEGGHDAEEDARACIELLERKMRGGPGYGEFKADYEGVFERLARSPRAAEGGLRTAIVDRGDPGKWHGAGAGTAVPCTSDEEVVKGVLEQVEGCDFVWARLMGLAEAQGCTFFHL